MAPDQIPDRAPAADISRMVTEHGTRLLRFAYLYLKDLHLAEDAVQEAFLKASLHYHRFRADSSELTWLTSITLNCCRGIRRSAWFRTAQRSVPVDALALAEKETAWLDDSLLQEVMRLPAKYKEILLLYYYQQLPLKDIAAMLRMNESTLSSRLKRARAMLKKHIEGWWFDGE